MFQLLGQIYNVYTSLRRPLDRKIFVVGMIAILVTTVVVVGQMKRAEDEANAPPTQVEMGAIVAGTGVSATLGAREEHVWGFAGQRGERISIELSGSWDRLLMVMNANGYQMLARDPAAAGSGPAFIDSIFLPSEGTYNIIVRGEDDGTGDYELVVRMLPARGTPAGTVTTVGPGSGPILIMQ
jgi:hypothetical protein